jgi:hypothetical protein
MTRTVRHTLLMRGTTIAATALAVALTACGTAQATHRPSAEGAGRQQATVVPIGPCKPDPAIVGGSTCSISTEALHDGTTQIGVQVAVENFNAYPVRIKIALYHENGIGHDDTLLRVPAHGSKSVLYDWGTRTQMAFAFYDDYNGKSLGSAVVDHP